MADITDLKQFAIPADERKELVEITVWYDNMPGCLNEVVGDRFGENVEQHRQSILEKLEEILEPTNYWISTFEVEGDKLFVVISNGTDGEDHSIEIVPA